MGDLICSKIETLPTVNMTRLWSKIGVQISKSIIFYAPLFILSSLVRFMRTLLLYSFILCI